MVPDVMLPYARLLAVVLSAALAANASRASFVEFAGGQVRPLALSSADPGHPGQTWLFAVNTPDNRLEIFDVSTGSATPTHLVSIPVGMEPVAVAARTNTEVWVVNHLSASVSIVQLDRTTPTASPVTNTLLVGDGPRDTFAHTVGPTTGLIVKYNGTHWQDRLARNWDPAVRFFLPDHDVFAIGANAATPAATGSFDHVGTVIFNMITNPASGVLYVSNTDAKNEFRFEGPGTYAATVVGAPAGPKTVRGHLHEADVTVISGATTAPVHLNSHINYGVVQAATPTASGTAGVFNPEPASITNGRSVLYDAFNTSSNGEASCSSCHIFGDFDSLAWDLGNPDDFSGGGPGVTASGVLNNPNPFRVGPFVESFSSGNGNREGFHPLKGPMPTQTLRGLANNGPMHWRGDRTGGNDAGGNALDENAAFLKFIVAFDGLLGRGSAITNTDMQN